MSAEVEREQVCVVLVRARNPNNIGAVARAMHDFGFRDLRLVSDYPVALHEARSAVDATEVLAGAREYKSVAEAVADCHLVVGTTAAGRRVLEHPLYTVAEGSGLLRATLAGGGRVALLFGSEKTGLSREELSHCHWIMTIPMFQRDDMRHPSMNLGQAAAVCLYELVRSESGNGAGSVSGPSQDIEIDPATAADLERLTGLMVELQDVSGHPAHPETYMRELVRRMRLNREDATAWMGILRKALWKLRR
jgi:tRNA/rRNA methyltransferase